MRNGHFESCAAPWDCWCEIKRYGLVLVIAMVILVAQVIGGIVSQSLALLADAGHVFTDTGAILVSIVVVYRIKRGSDEITNRKVGGYINAALLACVVVWIVFESWNRFLHPREITTWLMLTVAIAGTIGNYVQHQIIQSAEESHATHESMSLHVLSDLLQSIGVVIGGILIWISGWNIIDPIISLGIALWMGRMTWKLFSNLWAGRYDAIDAHSHDDH